VCVVCVCVCVLSPCAIMDLRVQYWPKLTARHRVATTCRKQSLLLKLLPPEGQEPKDKLTQVNSGAEGTRVASAPR
jgi:hypothetical protein